MCACCLDGLGFICLLRAVVVSSFRAHYESSAEVAVAGLRVITNLCLDDASNTQLGTAGACEGIYSVVKIHA